MIGQSQTPWTIVEWDEAKGRGIIQCDALGQLPFDASAALVHD